VAVLGRPDRTFWRYAMSGGLKISVFDFAGIPANLRLRLLAALAPKPCELFFLEDRPDQLAGRTGKQTSDELFCFRLIRRIIACLPVQVSCSLPD
jgi:hypothetical protein